jgi:hypothetical protein
MSTTKGPSPLRLIAGPTTRALLSILLNQSWDDWARADLHGARGLATEMRELGDATGDVVAQIVGCHFDGFFCFSFAGRAHLEKALALYDPAQRSSDAELMPFDRLVIIRSHLSWPLAFLGHLDQALIEQDAGLGEARRLSHPPTLAVALAGTGMLCVPWGPELQLQ